jgi:16S rRNA (adenine1518-N6/adenine1519-N6)-dimethyltransferase
MKARKRFGQHFLERAWAQKLVEVIAPGPADVFIEIGPGRGALTFPLASRAKKIIAVEIDRDLAGQVSSAAPSNVQVIAGDFLEVDLHGLVLSSELPVRVAGNLPYNISTPILSRLVKLSEDGRFFSDATLMLQREVADRLAARPGSRDYGVLAVLTQVHADIDRRLVLPPGAFRPAPRVTSAVVRLSFRPPRVNMVDRSLFDRLVRAVFAQRRKTIGNSLRPFAERRGMPAAQALEAAGIAAARRPETLEVTELANLADVFASAARPDVL